MPSQKALSKYPPEYGEFFLTAARSGIIIVTRTTQAEAETLRKELYNFRQALREETPLPPTREAHDLLLASDKLTFKIRGNKLIISINESVYLAIIKRALEDDLNE